MHGGDQFGGHEREAASFIEAMHLEKEERPGSLAVDVITDIFEAAKKPSVAAIDGVTIGGGLEIAMACHARISTPTAQIALPELTIGIIPGFGGTQRLPRLVGLPKALDMMLLSEPVKGQEAYSLGLVDAIVSADELVNTARQWALDIFHSRRPWAVSLHKTNKIEPLREAREILEFARAQTKKQAPNVEHPLICLDVIEEGLVFGPRAGLWKEAEAFQELLYSVTSKSLVHLLFAQRGTSEVPWITDIDLVPRRVNKVGIIGGGTMSPEIATALILSNFPVTLKEENDKFLQDGIGRVRANLQSSVKEGKMSEKDLENTISTLKGVVDYESFKDMDMVIEDAIENVSLKQQIFADLEKYCPPHCILASNTSTIDLSLIGERTKSQDRIVGAHFFRPAQPLLEIVRTRQTSPQVVVDLLDVVEKIKKTPVVVGDCTGFVVNRMLFPYVQAATLLVKRGADLYQIDRAITEFGMPMGPFRLADDMVGFDVHNFPERSYKSALIPLMQEKKTAGETTLKGLNVYDEKIEAGPDPELEKYIDPKLVKLPEKDIVEMIFFPVVNEACRVLDEGIAVKAADLDIAAVIAMGFPPYRGGIMYWADSLGSNYICSRLEEWSETYGDIFKPCSYLAQRAAKGIPLSSLVEEAESPS
ncbi:hypothetical protein FH972_015411 [Carpinus fangiana]|uniref:Uncharacterized protein n=1 Tax=Carpinus fangiana TaxID=176857 RepID=A0A5N6RDU0_9ROSI|nr:hypothetical protein FH972_015411 [Carpinus fangiana]